MGAAYFYHLTRRPLEDTLPMLLGKAQEAGWRVAVRGTTPARMEWLDEKLWLGPEEGFLPHGLATAPHAARQPILLTTGADSPTDPHCVMTIDGAEVTRLVELAGSGPAGGPTRTENGASAPAEPVEDRSPVD